MPSEHYEKYGKKWYQKNKQRQLDANAKVKARKKKEWVEYKATLACAKCGNNHPAVLDFHHPDPSKKEGNVVRLMSSGYYKRAYKEIEKCIVLCANCHRIHHYEERKQKKENKVLAPITEEG